MDDYKVYCHTNKTNGKKYIGITSRSVEERWADGRGYVKGRFGNAIRKYGWDGFTHDILFSGLTKEEACDEEIALIDLYDTTNPDYGYNMTSGGEDLLGSGNPFFGRKHSEESKAKMSESAKHRPPISEETRSKLSYVHKGYKMPREAVERARATRLANGGYRHTDEARLKMSIAKKGKTGRKHSEATKVKLSESKKTPVICVETGIVFQSMNEAAEFVGGTVAGICSVCTGKQKTHRKLHWSYLNGRGQHGFRL